MYPALFRNIPNKKTLCYDGVGVGWWAHLNVLGVSEPGQQCRGFLEEVWCQLELGRPGLVFRVTCESYPNPL